MDSTSIKQELQNTRYPTICRQMILKLLGLFIVLVYKLLHKIVRKNKISAMTLLTLFHLSHVTQMIDVHHFNINDDYYYSI